MLIKLITVHISDENPEWRKKDITEKTCKRSTIWIKMKMSFNNAVIIQYYKT